MAAISSYIIIIFFSTIIILSFLFNIFSEKTNIPSVLLLILLGVGLQFGLGYIGLSKEQLFPLLKILGTIGLIMIVLEAALDLELKKEKIGLIIKSFLVAFIGLVASVGATAAIFHFAGNYGLPQMSKSISLLYAIPLSILSSAIIIPSIGGLGEDKKEFMVYESTFSDILGIMFFYFFIDYLNNPVPTEIVKSIALNIGVSVLLSVIVSYILIYIFQHIKSHAKLFLLISILLALYSVAKYYHMSALLIILIFGLILNNQRIFFRGILDQWLDKNAIKEIEKNFKVITIESAFLVRTLFFVLFGLTIHLTSLLSIKVAAISGAVLVAIYLLRFLILKIFVWRNIFPQVFLAPRGLITILLFFAIPTKFAVPEFDTGILLFVILVSSVVMTYSLISEKRKQEELEYEQYLEHQRELEEKEKIDIIDSPIKNDNIDPTELAQQKPLSNENNDNPTSPIA